MRKVMILSLFSLILMSCSNNYSDGKRVGYITKFSNKGIIFKSWEGELGLSQTGMNTTSIWDFSLDNDLYKTDEYQVNLQNLKLALDSGFKVEITYNQVNGFNWFDNRGETNYFVDKVKIFK